MLYYSQELNQKESLIDSHLLNLELQLRFYPLAYLIKLFRIYIYTIIGRLLIGNKALYFNLVELSLLWIIDKKLDIANNFILKRFRHFNFSFISFRKAFLSNQSTLLSLEYEKDSSTSLTL